MQTRNPFIDDLTKVANGAMGALTGMKDEMEARVRDQIAKILDGMDIPRRDEFDAVKAMAAKAREENEELRKLLGECPKGNNQLGDYGHRAKDSQIDICKMCSMREAAARLANEGEVRS